MNSPFRKSAGRKIYIETYGCSSAKSDSEIMAGLLSREFRLVSNIKNSDVVILNTCIVKKRTENRMINRIKYIQEMHPDKRLIIAGCMPEAEPEVLRGVAPFSNLISTNKINEIERIVRKAIIGERLEIIGKEKNEKICLPKIRKNLVVDILEICSGCNHNCSYCITKLAKGSLFSYSPEKIIKEVKSAHNNRCKEFWITGQDVAAYNYNGKSLVDLLEEVIEVKGNYFLRLGMMNPASVLPTINELVEIYKNEHIFKFLHIPVQSGSNRILKNMKRNYTAGDFKKIVSEFRKKIPEMTIWTDIIAGFPGESNEDFSSSLELIRQTKPDFVNVSKFGARPKTGAAKMEQLPMAIKKERSRVISRLTYEISLERNRKWLNWSGPALIDEYNSQKKSWIARNYAYKPIVLSGNFRIGQSVDIKIIKSGRSLVGLYKG